MGGMSGPWDIMPAVDPAQLGAGLQGCVQPVASLHRLLTRLCSSFFLARCILIFLAASRAGLELV